MTIFITWTRTILTEEIYIWENEHHVCLGYCLWVINWAKCCSWGWALYPNFKLLNDLKLKLESWRRALTHAWKNMAKPRRKIVHSPYCPKMAHFDLFAQWSIPEQNLLYHRQHTVVSIKTTPSSVSYLRFSSLRWMNRCSVKRNLKIRHRTTIRYHYGTRWLW